MLQILTTSVRALRLQKNRTHRDGPGFLIQTEINSTVLTIISRLLQETRSLYRANTNQQATLHY